MDVSTTFRSLTLRLSCSSAETVAKVMLRVELDSDAPWIAIAAADVADIGAEVSIKSAVDPAVRDICCPIVVGNPALLDRHAGACGRPCFS